jgi:glucokinase
VTLLAGIDVGGTKCLGVVVDEHGVVLSSVRRSTPIAKEIVDLLLEIIDELGTHDSLGVGVPGLITPQGVVRASPNLKGAVEFPLRAELESRIGKRVWVDNDATVACLAEWQFGAARGHSDVWMVTLGTGIGGGLVSGGVLQHGANGFAGEIGHVVVDPDGPLCPCGRRGCWERYASGTGLAYLAGGEPGESLMVRALDGEPDALNVLDEYAKWIALGLANLTNTTDPSCIVLGGGLVTSFEILMPLVRRWFGEMLYSGSHRNNPELRAAELGEQAGAIGAALLPRHQ